MNSPIPLRFYLDQFVDPNGIGPIDAPVSTIAMLDRRSVQFPTVSSARSVGEASNRHGGIDGIFRHLAIDCPFSPRHRHESRSRNDEFVPSRNGLS